MSKNQRSKVKQRSSVTLSSNTLSQSPYRYKLVNLSTRSLVYSKKRILSEQYPFLWEDLFAKFMGTHYWYVPHKLNGIRVNRCLPDEPSQMMHRGKPLHGG